MKRPTYFILALLMALSACGLDGRPGVLGKLRIDSLETEPERPLPIDTTFEHAFSQFFSALQAGDTSALNQFIDPEQGLWLIEQPGAVPAYNHFKSIAQAERTYQQLPFTSINQQVKTCPLQQRDTLPTFDCADMDGQASGFSEDGCFYTFDTSGFQSTDMWKYANLDEQQAAQVQELQQQVQATVLHTGTAFRFHFGYRHGRWHLLFADLRVPCSA